MFEIDKINPVYINDIKSSNQTSLKDRTMQIKNQKKESGFKKVEKENFIYKNPKKAKRNNADGNIDPIKRPITVDESDNIFYINHNGENKSVKVEPGKYNLTELSSEIQRKVNETFGIGKVSVKITGSGSDRLIKAEDKIIFDFLDKNK